MSTKPLAPKPQPHIAVTNHRDPFKTHGDPATAHGDAATSPDPSLLRLPPELRLMIYEYLLPTFSDSEQPLRVPSVLHISRFIRKEAHDFWVKQLAAAIAEVRGVVQALSVEYDRLLSSPRSETRVLVPIYREYWKLEGRVRVLERLAWCLGVEV